MKTNIFWVLCAELTEALCHDFFLEDLSTSCTVEAGGA